MYSWLIMFIYTLIAIVLASIVLTLVVMGFRFLHEAFGFWGLYTGGVVVFAAWVTTLVRGR